MKKFQQLVTKLQIKFFVQLFIIYQFSFIITINAQQNTITSPQGIEFILIKPGKMVVGKFEPTVNQGYNFSGKSDRKTATKNQIHLPDSDYELAEKLAKADYSEGFEVEIKKAFYIGKFEITQAQWKVVMGFNPSYFQENKGIDNADNHPVESISWKDAQTFCKKLNTLDKTHNYRLPTEFEWEYAARAGAVDDIPWGEINKQAVIAKKTTSEVGSKSPNAWGIYDMLGNVWEWVEDIYNEKIFADRISPKKGKEHVLKGAPFYGDVKNATYMTHAAGPGSKYDVGFRIVMDSK